jgi:hypothetical protein
MKMKSFITAGLLLFVIAVHAQQTQNILDGKKFTIELMKGATLDSKETIVFDNGMMDPLDCHQYGFTAAKYEGKNSGGMYTWRVVSKSDKEGTMAWQGKITGDKIGGSVSWTKEGQAAINYTFKGTTAAAKSDK